MEMLFDYVVPFLVVLTILVFVHEMGHFSVARYNNVRVEVFAVGFGRELFGYTDRQGTRWKFCAIPFGGYVKMFGQGEEIEDENSDGEETRALTPDEKKVSFHHKRLGQRAAIVVAGPLANFIFAIIVLGLLFGIAGTPSPLAGIGSVQTESAAETAGFENGDRVVSINGEEVRWFEDLRQIVSSSPGMELKFGVERGDQLISLTATPKVHVSVDAEGAQNEIGLLGVTPDPEMIEYVDVGPLDAAWMGVERTYGLTTQILSALGQIISGSRTADELGGPLRIAQISGQMAQGGLISLAFFLAALSVNLGLINLFPVPMLDGGHLVFYGVEGILGRPVNAKTQEYSFRFGLALVLLLMFFATWNDLVQLKVFESIRNFIT